MKPLLTTISYEFRQSGMPAQHKRFLYDPEENAETAWLNDSRRDFNVYLRSLVQATDLESGAITVTWNDGVRALLPIPIHGAGSGITSIGDLVERIARMMSESDDLKDRNPGNDVMMRIADRIGRAPKSH